MKLIALVEPVPEEKYGAAGGPSREISTEASTYDEGRTALDELVQPGERLIWIRVPAMS